jgi:hypothetical protein
MCKGHHSFEVFSRYAVVEYMTSVNVVFAWGTPFEVIGVTVEFVAVLVVDFGFVFGVWDERKCYKPVDKKIAVLFVVVDAYSGVTVVIDCGFQNATSFVVPYSAVIADAVARGAVNLFPNCHIASFLRFLTISNCQTTLTDAYIVPPFCALVK